MLTNLANAFLTSEPFLSLSRQSWGIVGAGGVVAIIIVAIIFYMLGSHSERH